METAAGNQTLPPLETKRNGLVIFLTIILEQFGYLVPVDLYLATIVIISKHDDKFHH